jgi:rhodanese-related sulfurtransferase
MAREIQTHTAQGVDAPLEIDPVDLKRMRDERKDHLVVDVREQWELEIAALDQCLHLPLGDLPARYAELPKDRPVVVLCRTGRRSLQATMWLREQGYANAVNLRGGTHLWADQVDPSMRKY